MVTFSTQSVLFEPPTKGGASNFPQEYGLWKVRQIRLLYQCVMDFLSLRKTIVTKLAQIDTKEIHSVRITNNYIKSAVCLREEPS